MNVFIAGGSGAIGVPLVRKLVAAGHQVTALTRSASKAEMLRALGATPAVADALDAAALRRVVVAAHPTHVIHQLTALPQAGPKSAKELAPTNRLRIEGTRNLIDAAAAAGVKRFVVGSFAPLAAATPGSPSQVDEATEAIRSMESQVLDANARHLFEGIILRYGLFYGPENAMTKQMIALARRRMLPDGPRRSGFAAADPSRRRGERDGCGARARHARQHLRHRRRSSRQHERDGADDRRNRRSDETVRDTIVVAEAVLAVHGSSAVLAAAAVEREGARRARLAADVSDDPRRIFARRCSMRE